MSEFIAETTVVVKANTKPFSTELKKAVTQAERQKVTLQVVPSMVGFRNELVTSLKRSLRGVFAPVPVRPDMTGFRTALAAAIKRSATGLSVPIPVGVGAVGTARAGAAAPVQTSTAAAAATAKATTEAAAATTKRTEETVKATKAEKALSNAVAASAFARADITEEMTEQERLLLRQQRELQSIKAARTAITAAIAEQNAVAEKGARAQLRAAEAAEQKTARRITTLQTTDPELRAQRVISERDALIARSERVQERFLLKRKRLEDDIAKLRQRTATALPATADTTDLEIAEARRRATETERASIRAAQRAREQGFPALARELDAVAEENRLMRQQLALQKELNAARALGAKAALPVVTARTPAKEAAAQTRTAQRAAAELAAVTAAARAIGASAIAEESEALRRSTSAFVDHSSGVQKSAEAQERFNKSVEGSKRALTATSFQLVGLRGAALSAELPFLATAAAVIATAKAVSSFSEFESTLNVFRATTDATAEDMEAVRNTAVELGRDITLPGVGAQDAAAALTELSKAGLSVRDSMDAARGVLQLSTAANIENAEATELVASALNAFQLAGTEAVHVADVLANAANDSQGSIVDMGIALQQSAAVAKLAGLSVEQTVGVLTLFARAGLRGSDAGTSFRTGLIRLINPTKKANEEIKRLGLNLRTSTGAINLNFFQQFADATRDSTAAERDRILAVIGGQDAIRGFSILVRSGKVALDEQIVSLNKSGTAAEVAGARMQGIAGDVENLKNQISALGITLGGVFAGPLSVALAGLGNFVESLNEVADKIGNFVNPDEFKVAGANFDELTKRVIELQTSLQFTDLEFRPVITAQLTRSIEELERAGDSLVKRGFLKRFIKDFTELSPLVKRAMADNIIDPTEAAQLEADKLGQAFIGALPHTTEFFQSFGTSAKSAIEDAATELDRSGVPLIGAALKSAIEDGSRAAIAAAAQGGKDLGDATSNAFANAVEAIRQIFARVGREARLTIGRLKSEMLDLEIAGATPQKRLENIRAREEKAQTLVDIGIKQKLPRAEIDKRKEDLLAIIREREGVEDEITAARDKANADRKQKARDAQEKQDQADQVFFDSLAPREARVERQRIRAQGTDTLEDDRAALLARKRLLLDQIALIQENVNDTKKAAEEIRQRRTELVQLEIDIDENVQAIAEAEEEARRERFQRRQGRLEARQEGFAAVGDITGQLRIVNRRIAEYNKLLRGLRGERTVFEEYIREREVLRRDRERLEDEALTQQIELGQSIFDLTGNKNPLIRAIDAAIRDTNKEIAAARKAGQSTVALRTELNKLLLQRKNVLEETKEEAEKQQGTTAFDILQEAANTFRATGGNIIGGNQPFAGPTGFTADLAQFLRRQQAAVPLRGGIDVSDVPGRAIDRQIQSNNSLIDSLDGLKVSIDRIYGIGPTDGSGNKSTVPILPGSMRDRWLRQKHLAEATESRRTAERRSGI